MTRREMAFRELTRDPIFLLQSRSSRACAWKTETVFLTREEAEDFGKNHSYRWKYWQAYCVPVSGKLAELLRSLDPDDDRMQGRTFD